MPSLAESHLDRFRNAIRLCCFQKKVLGRRPNRHDRVLSSVIEYVDVSSSLSCQEGLFVSGSFLLLDYSCLCK
jgi:hypothetical protein